MIQNPTALPAEPFCLGTMAAASLPQLSVPDAAATAFGKKVFIRFGTEPGPLTYQFKLDPDEVFGNLEGTRVRRFFLGVYTLLSA